MSETNGHAPEPGEERDYDALANEHAALVTGNNAVKVQLASIRRLCEAGWPRGESCRLCKHIGSHSDNCYVRNSVGYDLLDEHETTLRENEQLRAALATHLPINGKHITKGGTFRSLRDRARGGRFSQHDD